MTVWFCESTRAAVATQVRQDELEFCSPLCERSDPILAGAGEPVQQQKRLTRSVNFEVELLTIEHFDATGRRCSRHLLFLLRTVVLTQKRKTARVCARAVRHLFSVYRENEKRGTANCTRKVIRLRKPAVSWRRGRRRRREDCGQWLQPPCDKTRWPCPSRRVSDKSGQAGTG